MIENFSEQLASFLIKAQQHIDNDFLSMKSSRPAPRLSLEHGRRYVRIVATDSQRCAFGFVDTTTGDVLKADGWKAPAKHARGNIFDANSGLGRVRWTGVH